MMTMPKPLHPHSEIKAVHQVLKLAICPAKTESSWLIVRDPLRGRSWPGWRSWLVCGPHGPSGCGHHGLKQIHNSCAPDGGDGVSSWNSTPSDFTSSPVQSCWSLASFIKAWGCLVIHRAEKQSEYSCNMENMKPYAFQLFLWLWDIQHLWKLASKPMPLLWFSKNKK